jgi:6-phosphogluconolactonase
MPASIEVVNCTDTQGLVLKATDLLLSLLAESRERHLANKSGFFPSLALSGGSTPKKVYERLGETALSNLVEPKVGFYFGDVRMVPDDHTDSNYRMAHESLLHRIPPSQVFPINVTVTAAAAAKEYEQVLQKNLPLVVEGEKRVPVFDLVLLGVGDDGHTASLFPGSAASMDYENICATCMPGPTVRPLVERVTLTPLTILHAKNIVVLATGKTKKWVIQSILSETAEPAAVASFLRKASGKVFVLVDEEALP